MYYFKTDNTLPDDARLIREMVFVKEQGFEDEFDDQDAAATHLVLYGDDGTPMGTGRFFKSGERVSQKTLWRDHPAGSRETDKSSGSKRNPAGGPGAGKRIL